MNRDVCFDLLLIGPGEVLLIEFMNAFLSFHIISINVNSVKNHIGTITCTCMGRP